nr:TPA_asm: NADH dehydrogenase subunit 5 [Pseudomyrmex elongatus]
MFSMLMYSFFMFLLSINMFLLSFMAKLYELMLVFEWLLFNHKSSNMTFYILLDWMSFQFIGVVMLISSMVMFYSTIYMSGDLNLERFYLLVFMFILSMVMMIISPNLISILLGWDGLGLVSYCLVIYYNNYSSYNSGMVTVLSNRVGDIGLLMAIGLAISYGSWSIFSLDKSYIIIFMILLGAVTKSAQIPFSYWLPQAMAAPTPVSSLVHSSTLVTAGVYLLIRFNDLLMSSKFNMILFSMSLLTMFMSGLMANFEFDLKKIIALSTLSQLGLMMMILSIGVKNLAFFHLETHAIFKSLLFLCAGALIHLMINNQDIRYYGKMNEFSPFIMMSFYISSLSLCGMPFMAGFYSKDFIMEIFYNSSINLFLMIMSILSLCFTVSYTVRLIYYLYFGSVKFYFSWFNISSSWGMNLSMFFLLMFSVLSGSMLSWILFFDMYEIFMDVSVKIITIVACLMGVIMGFMFYLFNMMKFYFFSYFISTMWMMMFFYSFVYKPFMTYWRLSNEIDKVWMEFSGKIFIIYIFENFKSMSVDFNKIVYMFCYISLLFLLFIIII